MENSDETRNDGSHGPCVLVIRDGWGENPHEEEAEFNAVQCAKTPVADGLKKHWPTSLLRTSGPDVGLPMSANGPVMGNSEVGHQNIGAGRIVNQELQRITQAIGSGAFFEIPGLKSAFEHARETGGSVHLLGLVSDGQVHSDMGHLEALIDFAMRSDWPASRLHVHAITDGRDTIPTSGLRFLSNLDSKLEECGFRQTASVMGRYWAMDRDNRWERIERAYQCLVDQPDEFQTDAKAALERHYARPESENLSGDEFMPPTAIGRTLQEAKDSRICDGDSVIFFNFRGDRPREMAKAMVLEDERFREEPGGGFERRHRVKNLRFTGMTRYQEGLPISVIFEKPEKLQGILGAALSEAGRTQLRCAETEKFPHVTFFFNDYREDPFDGERRILVQSPTDVATYDEKPEMSAREICRAVLERIDSKDCESLIVVNFANGDMVGHTGVFEAAKTACEVVDECVGRLVEATISRGGSLLITADHGNAERMWNAAEACPHTAHTNFDVPIHLIGNRWKDARLREHGRLADIGPTILEMMSVPVPEAMTGESLILP